jgi:acylphosphatase
MVEMRCTITGKVQGVRYRDYAQVSAGELGLVGTVSNLVDGSVLVVAQGEPDLLKDFVEFLHEGSLMAEVEGVSIEWGTIDVTYDDFSVLH